MLNAQIVYSPCDIHTNCNYFISDSIVFEQPTQLLIFDNDSLWQIGTPGKTIFNQAWSPNFAIMTDTINPYPDSSNTSFWFKIKPYEFGDLFIAFNHMVDVGMGDSCIIEMSLDGLEWFSIIDFLQNSFNYSFPMMHSFNTDLQTLTTQTNFTPETPKNLYFTDTTFGWTQTIIWIDWLIMVKENFINKFADSLYFRFRFTSGINSFNNEGWIIDNFYLGSFSYKSGNISDFQNKSFIKIFPNPADNFIEWDLNELESPINITISNLNGIEIQSEIVNSNHFNVSKIPNGYYLLKFIDNSGKIFHSKLLISR